MKRRLKLVLIAITFIVSITPATALAFNPFSGVNCSGASQSTVCAQSSQPTGNPLYGSNSILGKAIQLLSFFAGVAAIILLIVGGVQFATSAGNPDRAGAAKRTIMYALIGIGIVILAQMIVIFGINAA